MVTYMSVKKKQLVTSLRVNPELWKEAKVHAIRNDMTLAELVDNALKKWIEEHGGKKQ